MRRNWKARSGSLLGGVYWLYLLLLMTCEVWNAFEGWCDSHLKIYHISTVIAIENSRWVAATVGLDRQLRLLAREFITLKVIKNRFGNLCHQAA